MSRRNQSRRRRSYGRRQHEVRERRFDYGSAPDWLRQGDSAYDGDWHVNDGADERGSFDTFGSFGR